MVICLLNIKRCRCLCKFCSQGRLSCAGGDNNGRLQINRLDGKVAIITGAGSGIGRTTALLFAKEGAKLVIADIDVPAGEETLRMIEDAGGKAQFIKTDVSVVADIKNMIKNAVDIYGRLDILYNNAGIVGKVEPTHEASESCFNKIIDINLKGVFLGMKYGIAEMLKTGGGSIINTASAAGLVGFQGLAAYSASKGGVVQLTKTAALEYATQNIRINCVCPGVIWTPMVEGITGDDEEAKAQFTKMEPVGRMGTPEEIAKAALFLACDDSSFVTGVALPVDGGLTAQ